MPVRRTLMSRGWSTPFRPGIRRARRSPVPRTWFAPAVLRLAVLRLAVLHLAVLRLAVLLFAAPAVSAGCARSGERDPVARVGTQAITARMLELRRQQLELYYPGQGTPERALAQLVHGYLAAELLREEGAVIDAPALRAEDRRIRQQSRNPERLRRLRAVYEGDEEAWLTVGVLPEFARATLWRHFLGSPQHAAPARELAERLLRRAAEAPETFATAAQAEGLSASRGRLNPAASAAEDRAAVTQLLRLLEPLANGALLPRPLETPESIQAIRLIERFPDGSVEVERVVVPRPDFHDWFRARAARLPVAVADPLLRERLGEIGWARELLAAE